MPDEVDRRQDEQFDGGRARRRAEWENEGVDEDPSDSPDATTLADFEAWTAELQSKGANPEAELAAWHLWVTGHPDRPAPPPGLLACEVCGAYRPMADLLSGTVPAPAGSDPGVDRILVVCCVGCRPQPTLGDLREVMGRLRWPNRSETAGQCVVCGGYTQALDSSGSYCHPRCMG
jgi:hypothetical protein